MDRAGGTPLLAQRLLEAGKLNGDVMTVTGRTIAEEAASAVETPGQRRWIQWFAEHSGRGTTPPG